MRGARFLLLRFEAVFLNSRLERFPDIFFRYLAMIFGPFGVSQYS